MFGCGYDKTVEFERELYKYRNGHDCGRIVTRTYEDEIKGVE